MKKFNVLALSVIMVVAAVFTSCGKYEEGPAISLRSKKARLANTWKVDKYVDGESGEESEPDPNDESTIRIEKDGSYVVSSGGFSFEGEWAFVNDKQDLQVTFTYSFGGSSTTTTTTSEILRLANDELWLKDKDDGDETHLVPAN